MAKQNHIVILEPSLIIRSGLMTLLHDLFSSNKIECTEISHSDDILNLNTDLVIANPSYISGETIQKLRDNGVKLISLQSSLTNSYTLGLYDTSISIYDNEEKIKETVSSIIEQQQEPEFKTELSAREKEIVVCVAKGMTNKEIADTLFLSTHTVISHRRNIASKLEIHSSSGLTVYAIVNKLIDIENL